MAVAGRSTGDERRRAVKDHACSAQVRECMYRYNRLMIRVNLISCTKQMQSFGVGLLDAEG